MGQAERFTDTRNKRCDRSKTLVLDLPAVLAPLLWSAHWVARAKSSPLIGDGGRGEAGGYPPPPTLSASDELPSSFSRPPPQAAEQLSSFGRSRMAALRSFG
jgi:hypothetical protein